MPPGTPGMTATWSCPGTRRFGGGYAARSPWRGLHHSPGREWLDAVSGALCICRLRQLRVSCPFAIYGPPRDARGTLGSTAERARCGDLSGIARVDRERPACPDGIREHPRPRYCGSLGKRRLGRRPGFRECRTCLSCHRRKVRPSQLVVVGARCLLSLRAVGWVQPIATLPVPGS